MNVIYADGYKKVDIHKLRIDVLNSISNIHYQFIIRKVAIAMRNVNTNYNVEIHRFQQSFVNHMFKLMRSENSVSTKFLNEVTANRHFMWYSGTLYELVDSAGEVWPNTTHKFAFVRTDSKHNFYHVNPISNNVYYQLSQVLPLYGPKIDLVAYGVIPVEVDA